MTVKVLVSECVWDERAKSWRLSLKSKSGFDGTSMEGPDLEANYPTVEQARLVADMYVGEGKSVIVRPTYNETDADGSFFREWRSFNGEPFKECRWGF